MADVRILHDIDTGQQFFPYTHENAVLGDNGELVIKKLKNEIENLKESGSGATSEQLAQIEQNKNDISELSEHIDELQEAKVVVSNDEPTEAILWIDKDSDEEVILAEIDDKKVSEEMTWSSQKINTMFTEYVEEIAELVGGDA